MNLGVITYDAPHRKTQDLVSRLIMSGHGDIYLIALPWIERSSANPIFRHRPPQTTDVNAEDLARRFKLDFIRAAASDLDNLLSGKLFDHVLIGGAGLIPGDIATNHRIINSHPGYLPNVRGLDAFKWAIYQGQPIGVTTHYISADADEGILIERRIVPVYFEDTFHSVAYRLYETEIEMLVGSVKEIAIEVPTLEPLADRRFTPNRRMPHHYEIIMMNRFEEMRRRSKSVRDV